MDKNTTYADRMVSAFRYVKSIRGYAKAVRFVLHAQFHKKIYENWLEYLNNGLPVILPQDACDGLAYKVSRPYLRRWLTVRDRMNVITYHNAILEKSLSVPGLRRILEGGYLQCLQLTGKSGRTYALIVGREPTKEGQLRFRFMDMALNKSLADMCGTFYTDEAGCTAFWIGGMQGAKPPHSREAVSAATRDLNNMRPKQAVLQGVCTFAQWFGAQSLIAPGQKNHVSHRWWRLLFRFRLIHSDLDGFWSEFSHTRDARGDYVLPLPLPRRNLADVQSKRKKDWIARYARIDRLAAAMVSTLGSLAQGPHAADDATPVINFCGQSHQIPRQDIAAACGSISPQDFRRASVS